MGFPEHRLRRLRLNQALRRMVKETRLSVNNLIYPLFVVGEDDSKVPISAIPGCHYLSGNYLLQEAEEIVGLGIPAVLLFGVPAENEKDEKASGSYSEKGAVQKAVQTLKHEYPELIVVTDLCLCEYTLDGHCGVIRNGQIDNDATLEIIRKAALSQARAGSDVIAPSGMMDGVVQSIRSALDECDYRNTLIMPYSAKFASKLYGPFKEVTRSGPRIGKHATHQLDIANGREALREVRLDIEEGADMVIVKPALPCLDIIWRVRAEFEVPVAAYSVSGEYTMLLETVQKSMMDKNELIIETLTCIKRAGADLIVTYFAKEAARIIGS